MRDCVFLLADLNMKATFLGFLTRQKFYMSLGISEFDFDPDQDLIVHTGGNDPGVYNNAHNLLGFYQKSHRYAVIVLDNEWSGSPDVRNIETHISSNMIRNGWSKRLFVNVR
jgi:hypothetical protein